MVVKQCGKLIVCETVVYEQAGVNRPWLLGYTCRGWVGSTLGRVLLSALMTLRAVVHCGAYALSFCQLKNQMAFLSICASWRDGFLLPVYLQNILVSAWEWCWWCTPVYRIGCLCTYVEARGWCWLSSSISLHFIFWDYLNLELMIWPD